MSKLTPAIRKAAKLRTAMRFNSVVLLIFTILFGCSTLLADEQSWTGSPSPQPDKYRVFLLRFISAHDGLQFLDDANIKTASVLNDNKTLLVTAQPDVLIKAAALLNLVDSSEKYAVRALLPASEANRMPATGIIQEKIANGIKPVSIGTFMNPPGNAGYTKVIIDIHGDKLVAVAPASIMDKLIAIAEQVKQAGPSQGQVSNKTGASEKEDILLQAEEQKPDKLFKELLDSIAEAEKMLAEQDLDTNQTVPDAEPVLPRSTPGPQKKEIEEITSVNSAVQTPPDELAAAETNKPEPTNPYEPQVVPNADEMLDLALPEKLEIIPFLDLVGKYLNLNYVYDPQQLLNKPQVHLKVQGPVKVSELYPLAESVLKFSNLAMMRKGNLVTIVSLENALDYDPVLIWADSGQVRAGDIVVTRIFQLNYIDTAQAKAVLDGMKVGAVTELPGMGTLIVTGYAYRMSRVEELLEIIDKPGKPKQFKFRQLKYTMAITLAPKVKQLVEQLGDISITLAAPQAPAMPPGRRVPVRRPTPTQPAPTTTPSKPTIYLDADERTNRILMIGDEDEIAVVENLIDALDVEQQDIRSIRVYEIQHVGAEEVRKKLEELGIVGAGRATTPGRITARAAAAARAQPGAPPSPTPMLAGAEAALPTEEMQVVIIESTNSLMVNASPEQHALVATIIAYVDSETIQQAIPYVVYPLENQNPQDLADVLTKLIQETVLDKEGKIQQVIQRQEDQIVIVPDESTFSLIVFASKKNQEWISSLIKSLDRRRPQVLIDVMLVSITEDDSFTYDLQMVSKLPEMVAGGGMQKLPALLQNTTTGFPSNVVQEFTSYPGTTGGQGFYADKHIQALLSLMQKKGYGRILSRPKILVNDNEKGHIDTTTTLYVSRVTNQYLPNTTTTPTTTNTAITSTTFEQYPSGIKLDITPHISEGNLLRLEVQVSQSSQPAPAGGLAQDQPPPTKSENNVDTVVTVPDNSTIILGGIIQLTQNKNNSKVPFLGDIPIVGGLFRNISNTNNQAKLYVFVKANILRPDNTAGGLADLQKMSDKNRGAVEEFEKKFQEHQDWPGIKPKPVDPARVLDAE
ncbi:MAG: secretin N-terminal domain-containing protein [Planctomycetota bacterium]